MTWNSVWLHRAQLTVACLVCGQRLFSTSLISGFSQRIIKHFQMTFNNSSINTLGRDSDFCNVTPTYVYVKCHENGSFSKADETCIGFAVGQNFLWSSCFSAFIGLSYAEIFESHLVKPVWESGFGWLYACAFVPILLLFDGYKNSLCPLHLLQ